MKVRVDICKTIEVEISDKHRGLALNINDPNRKYITDEQIAECIQETAKVVGLPWGDDITNTKGECFYCIESVENGYPMCEF